MTEGGLMVQQLKSFEYNHQVEYTSPYIKTYNEVVNVEKF